MLAALLSMSLVTAQPPVLAGYLPSWAFDGFSLSRIERTTDVLYFSIQPNADGTLNLSDIDQGQIPKLRQAAKDHGVRLLICVGGWERSAGFYPMASNDATRARFVENALTFCQTKGFDGIDLDWEHPKDANEAKTYGTLIKDLRARFAPTGRIVTAAIAAWQPMDPVAVQNLDRVHLMSYDHEGKHATFEDANKDVELLRAMGFPSSKIVVGVPFYGRSLTNWGQELTYREIIAKFNPPPSADEAGGYFFNGQAMMERKAKFVLDQKLGGIMIWELTQDVDGPRSLLKTLYDTLNP